jgi:hypothetical protein
MVVMTTYVCARTHTLSDLYYIRRLYIKSGKHTRNRSFYGGGASGDVYDDED